MNEGTFQEGSAAPPRETTTPTAATAEATASSQIVVPAQACPTCNAPRTATSRRGLTLTRGTANVSLILLFVFVSGAFIPIPRLCITVSL